MKKLIIFVFTISVILSCKDKETTVNDTSADLEGQKMEMVNAETSKPQNPYVLPDPCELVSMKEIAEIFKLKEEQISTNPGNTGQGQEFTSSCFITWEKDGDRLGFLLQVMKNPLYGEFDEWATSYINVLSTNGEMSFPDNVAHVYKPMDGLGDAGVYNEELGKMYWRKGNDLVIGLIFRNDNQKPSLKKNGKKLADIIMKKVK